MRTTSNNSAAPAIPRKLPLAWLVILLAAMLINPAKADSPPPAPDTAPAAPALDLSAAERAWLAAHPRITIGINQAWPPMDFVDEQGVAKGIGVDFIDAINQRLGGVLEVVPGSWETIYDGVRSGQLDALMDITPRRDREQDFLFTSPYINVPHVFITQRGRPYIAGLEDLRGQSLAVERGFYLATLLDREFPDITVHQYDNTSEALDAVARGLSHAYAGNRAAATYILTNEVITNLEVHGEVRESASINAIGVRKDAPELRSILDKALDSMGLRERVTILERWTLGHQLISASDLGLTSEEWLWLEDHPVIHIAGDPAFPPIEFSDRDGHAMGIAAEYLGILSDALGVRFEYADGASWQQAVDSLRNRELDMYAAAAATPQRQAYAHFTQPYLRVPVMIFAHQRSPGISSLDDFAGKRVAMVDGYAVTEMVNADNWAMEVVTVPDIASGLQAVQSGDADAFVGNVLSASYVIRQLALTDIHIAGHTPYRLDLAMGVRSDWPELVGILDKALARISEPQRAQIAARWIGIQVREPADYSLAWNILALAGVALLLILAWNWSLRRKVNQHTAHIRSQNRELTQRQQELGLAQQIARLGSWTLDLKTNRFAASDILRDILGLREDSQLNSLDDYLARVEPGQREAVGRRIRDSMEDGSPFDQEYSLIRDDGRRANVRELGEVVRDVGLPRHVLSTVQDISERRSTESTLRKLQQAFDKSTGAIIISDLDNRIEYVNQAFSRITGYQARDAIGRDSIALLTPANLQEDYRAIMAAARQGQVWHGEMLSHRRNGEPFWEDVTIAPILDSDGKVANVLELRQDISSQKAIQERLFREVNFCPLTRLPNQAYLMRDIGQRLDQGRPLALIFTNLLNLKRINDGLGFESGDALIIQAARRLDEVVDKPGLLAHLGGGQYIVKLDTNNVAAIEGQIARIFGCFKLPYRVGSEQISQNVSVGVVRSPEDGGTAHELLSRAHVAANQAKSLGAASWCYFSEEYSQQTHSQLHMENLLAQALERGEFSIAYQPKINILTGLPTGAEALLRWHNGELGQVPPNQFIPVAEQSDLIIDIGRWVIGESIGQARTWRDQGFSGFALAINLSPRQFLDSQLVTFIGETLESHGVDGSLIELELTESLLMESSDAISQQMESLKALGIKLVLDDFGTGFSSLSYLQKFPFDGLKIDRSFVYGYPAYQGNVGLVKAIIAMGKALDMKLVAEGIETQEQADFLVAEECYEFQGYLYGKPMAEGDFMNWLVHQGPLRARMH